jgi:hypothetical protein
MKTALTVAMLAAVVAVGSGCFLTPTFERLGVTESFVKQTTKQYIVDKGYDKYVDGKQVDRIVAAAEESIAFQEVMTEVMAREASKAKVEEVVQTLLSSGAFPVPAPGAEPTEDKAVTE